MPSFCYINTSKTIRGIILATPIYYFDISKTGKDYVGKRDILLLTNEQAVLEAIKNIIITEPGERVMNPDFGCPIQHYLFEPIDPITMVSLKIAVTDAIWKWEDNRIENLDVQVTSDPDLNTLSITVVFNIKASTQTQSLTLSLNKIR
jgi:phage baseplate assembly protein W